VGKKLLHKVLAVVIKDTLKDLHAFVSKGLGDESGLDCGLDFGLATGLIKLEDLRAGTELVIEKHHSRGNRKLRRRAYAKEVESLNRFRHPLRIRPAVFSFEEFCRFKGISDSFAYASKKALESLIKLDLTLNFQLIW
jgi:hypothetical protein